MEDDDLKPEMEAVKYFLWLNSDRAGMFFSQNVLLVEGPSEIALINRLLDDGKLTLPHEVYILDCLGKYNIHRFMSLLSALGVQHSVLHDDDENKNEHQELNQLISSKSSDFTKNIVSLTNNLETVLGVPLSGSNHRKPQHLLYCYSENQIDEAKLGDFCAKVQSCFADGESFND